MSVVTGSNQVTNGLVFDYDMNNTGRSWLGKPTTNTTTGVNLGFGGERWSNVSTQDYPDKNNLPFALKGPVWRLTNGNNYWGYAGDFAITAGNTYTISGWYYVATTQTMIWYNDVWTSGYASVVSSVASDTFVSTNNTNGWRYGSKTLTIAPASSPFYVRGTITDGSGDTTPTGNVYMANFQIEQQSFATPFVNGTRSNTQALLDLTATNTVTANSLTYNSDNTFTFAGAVNYCTVSNLDSLVGDVTLESVVNLGTANGPHQTSICTDLNYRCGLKLLASYHGNMAVWAGFGTTDYLLGSSTSLQNAGNAYIAATRSSSTGLISLYLNGVLINSATTTTGNMSSAGSSQGRIGLEYHSSSYGFNGKIYSSKAYNRVLSAAEIAQNFNAQRSLYGI
jgi:hypothetical protein